MSHPDDDTLRLFASGRLDDGREEEIESHLAACPDCTQRLANLERNRPASLMHDMKEALNDPHSMVDKSAAVDATLDYNPSDPDPTAYYPSSSSAKSAGFTPGYRLGGNFRLEKQLGRGGMGEAWKAYDETAERYVVLKFVPREIQHIVEAMEGVRDSFKKVHALQHQHICPLYALHNDPLYGLYVVMKFIDGLPLDVYRRKYVAKHGSVSFTDTVQILWAIAKGLDYAHEKKVIHRDIKPQNVMIGKSDGVQIIDFGLAEEIRSSMAQYSGVVATHVSGTRPYMAPEQWRGRLQDARTDQYALAVTAYELFAGHVPFYSSDSDVLRNCVLNDSPEPIHGLPEHVNIALLKALSKKREDRYESCKEFVKALATKPQQKPIDPVPAETVALEEGNAERSAVVTLPTDASSDTVQPPMWLPQAMPSSNSSRSPEPFIVETKRDVKPKRVSMAWLIPVGIAVIVGTTALFGFLLTRSAPVRPVPLPSQQVAVKQVTETPIDPEPTLEPVSEHIELEEPPTIAEQNYEPMTTDAEERKASDQKTNPFTTDGPLVAAPSPKPAFETTPEPIEATEARLRFEEEVAKVKQYYRDAIEKELDIARKTGNLAPVVILEGELKSLEKSGLKLTAYKPEKRTLFNAKVQTKKRFETALASYQKTLDAIVKELVRAERTDGARIVQEMLDHAMNPATALTIPTRLPGPKFSVIRVTLTLGVDGRGTYAVQRCSSTDPPDGFRGTKFPLSAFPKAQAFRGEEGLGRVFFDFRDADPDTAWEKSGWDHWRSSPVVDVNRKTLLFMARPDLHASITVKKGKPPFRGCVEFVDRPGLIPSVCLATGNRKANDIYLVHTWGDVDTAGKVRLAAHLEDRQAFVKSDTPVALPFAKEFQLSKDTVDNLGSIQFSAWLEVGRGGSTEDSFSLGFFDITGRLFASVGLEMEDREGMTVIQQIVPDSPASRSGLQEGDVIVRFNGRRRPMEEICQMVEEMNFGDPITVATVRDGEEKVYRFYAE